MSQPENEPPDLIPHDDDPDPDSVIHIHHEEMLETASHSRQPAPEPLITSEHTTIETFLQDESITK